MKRRFLCLLPLLALFFVSCNDLAQGMDNSTSSQNAQNAGTELASARSVSDRARQIIQTHKSDNVNALKEAADNLDNAIKALTDVINADSLDLDALNKAVEDVKNAVTAVEAEIKKIESNASGQKSDEPTPPTEEPKQDDDPKTEPTQPAVEPGDSKAISEARAAISVVKDALNLLEESPYTIDIELHLPTLQANIGKLKDAFAVLKSETERAAVDAENAAFAPVANARTAANVGSGNVFNAPVAAQVAVPMANAAAQSTQSDLEKLNAALGSIKDAIEKFETALAAFNEQQDAIATLEAAIAEAENAIQEAYNAEANIKPDYEFRTLHKIGKDNESYIIVFIGDGFTESQQEDFFKTAKDRADYLLTFEPFKSMKDQINIYAISTVSKEEGVSERYRGIEKDTYLKVLKTTWERYTLHIEKEDRFRALKQKLEETFDKDADEKSAGIDTVHVISNSSEYFGSAPYSGLSFSSISGGKYVSIHEMGHSIGKLGDEYAPSDGYANTYTFLALQRGKELPWEKFRGFRGVGRKNGGNGYIPTNSRCIMASTGEHRFCEVCKWMLASRMSSAIYRENPNPLYIAEPEIKLDDEGKLTFRAIVQNLQYSERKITIRITDKNGKVHEAPEVYTIPPLVSKYPTSNYEFDVACVSIAFDLKDVADSGEGAKTEFIDNDTDTVFATYEYHKQIEEDWWL